MKREDIMDFLYEDIKLVLRNDFILWGCIDKVNDCSIHFTTKQAISIINFDEIKMIIRKAR
jgi:hypothetical protein